MNRRHSSSFRNIAGFVALLALAILNKPAQAQFTWDGQFSNQWNFYLSGITNWSPEGLIPGSAHTVAFGGGVFPVNFTTVDLNGNRSVLSITFADPLVGDLVDYQLNSSSGTDVLTLVDGEITATGTRTHSINVDLDLGSGADWSINNPLLVVSDHVTT